MRNLNALCDLRVFSLSRIACESPATKRTDLPDVLVAGSHQGAAYRPPLKALPGTSMVELGNILPAVKIPAPLLYAHSVFQVTNSAIFRRHTG